MGTPAFIAVDWGTTSFRAYLVDQTGKVMDEVAAPDGILAVKDGGFDAVLEQRIAAWDTALPVLAAGMITSRQGWFELPYVECPAGPTELAKAMHRHVMASGRVIHFSTGLHYLSPTLGHDVMRSEETQVFGALDGDSAHFITPGTHSKWIDVEAGRITRFDTYMTGEMFAVMKAHSILGRLMTGDRHDAATFRKGVELALAEPSGLSHLLFSVRSRGLFNDIAGDDLSSYLSGLVIGTEVGHALMARPQAETYCILASPKIGGAYVEALDVAGLKARYGDGQAIVKGLLQIGKAAGILS
jgi:2-dehydro-3-deoxygalactonokinase